MRITTRVTYATVDDFINNAIPTSWEGFEYSGPIAECKKGRSQLNSASNAGVSNINTANDLTNTGEKIANSEINTSGGLSPLVGKQLANEEGSIGKAYTGAAQAAQRGLAMRGMGSAPSGTSASIANTGVNNEGQAVTGAVGNAFGTQNQLNNTALTQPINALNAGNSAVNATTGAASSLNKAGSTLGDVGAGLTGLAGIGTGLFGAQGIFGKGAGGGAFGS